jgi:hypothetical protein
VNGIVHRAWFWRYRCVPSTTSEQVIPMKTSPRCPLHLAAAVQKALSAARGIAQACPIALNAVLAAASMSFAIGAQAGNIYTVTTAGDPGPGGTLSLRQAITTANASADNVIEFAPALIGSTITLAGGEIAIQKPMTITGPGADVLTISGANASRIFFIRPVPDDLVPDHTYVTISGMTLTKGFGNYGGAIRSVHASLLLTDSKITASNAQFGGGIYSLAGATQVDYSRLAGNQASFRGGALYSIQDTSVNLSSDTFSANSAGLQGGGMVVATANTLTIQTSTISSNYILQPQPYSHAQGGGGIALRNIGTLAFILNSTITQNYAPTGGGGVALLDTKTGNLAQFYFSTIVGNFASVDETGIGITSAGGTATLYATIVANNISQTSADDLAGSFLANHSLIKSPGGATITGSGSLIGQDPQLGPLVDNLGWTFTMLPATTSPVIGQVPCSCTPLSVHDQRGLARHFSADIGAVERQYPEPLIFRNGFDPQ